MGSANFIDPKQVPLQHPEDPGPHFSVYTLAPGCGESMHSLLFSPRSGTITKIYLPVNVPCLVNHWVVNLNNSNVPSLSNSIKVQTKVMLKNIFQAKEYTIMVLHPHKLNNTFIPLFEKGQCMINTGQKENKSNDSE